jgi:hypothetical protein
VSPGFFFPWHLTVPCALGSTQPLKNEYQVNLGGKGGRCVRLTTYHLHVPMSRNLGAFNLLEPFGPLQACNGTASAFYSPSDSLIIVILPKYIHVFVICTIVFTVSCTVCTVFLYCFVYVYLFLFVSFVLV